MSKTIMIIEDEQNFHTLYEIILEDTDYRIIHTSNEDEALSKLEEEKPDLIILGIVLNKARDIIFFLYLRSIPEYADIPVIITSILSEKYHKALRIVNPKLVYIKKTDLTKERLLNEVENIMLF
jgi:DNA-binding response OmpR family regulator